MTKQNYIAIATILGRWKGQMEREVFNGLEQNFADMLMKDNPRFDDDKFIEHIDKIANEWGI